MADPNPPDAHSPLSDRELAARGHVPVDRIHALTEMGILDAIDGSYRDSDVRRVRFVDACERAGMPLPGIAEAIERGTVSLAFLDHPHYRWAAYTETTFERACEDAGIEIATLQRMYEAASLPRPDPAAPARADDLILVELLGTITALGIDETGAVHAMRTYGENLRRMAQAETGLYHDLIETPLLQQGLTQQQMREAANRMDHVVDPAVRQLITTLYQRHQEHYWIADMLEHVEGALGEAGIEVRHDGQPPAMCFLDLAGYTHLTEQEGDRAAANAARRLGDLVQQTSTQHGGHPVKWLGDGVMFHFPRADAAVAACLEMVDGVPRVDLPPAHAGVSAGPVVVQDGDYFGRTVNLASRISDRAEPGQTLVTDDVARLADGQGVAFRRVGEVALKGVSDPVTLHEALRH